MAIALFLTACGDGEDPLAQNELELESAKKALFFYGPVTNTHLAYDTEAEELIELNTYKDDANNTNFALDNNESGWLFVWVDDLGDDNASTYEDKVVMFDADYSYADDGNATWEDFYYIGHYHEHEDHDENETQEEHAEHEYELAAHTNDEFNDTNVSSEAYLAIQRLNAYLAAQETLKESLRNAIASVENPSDDICNYYTLKHEGHEEDEGDVHEEEEHEEDTQFVLGTNGRLYVFHDDNGTFEFKDSTLISSSGCSPRESGVSPTSEGVLVYLKQTATLYLVDSHGDARTHVHSSWDISDVVGDGNSIDMMVGIKTVEIEGDAHDH